MPCLFYIDDWDEHFENSKTRTMKKTMRWVPIPTKHDGDGYTELLEEPDGPALYGCWVAIVALAGKCETRGVLTRSRGMPMPESGEVDKTPPGVTSKVCGEVHNLPHDVASISRIIRFPRGVVKRTLEVAGSQLAWIGCIWLDENGLETECPKPDGCHLPRKEGKGREGKGKEGKGKEPEPVSASQLQKEGGQLQAVWRYYKSRRPRARVLSDRYRSKIAARLREGWSVADLKAAIDGNYLSEFHCGRGPGSDGTEYHNLDLICRDSDHVERFIQIKLSHANGRAGDTAATRQTRDAVERFTTSDEGEESFPRRYRTSEQETFFHDDDVQS